MLGVVYILHVYIYVCVHITEYNQSFHLFTLATEVYTVNMWLFGRVLIGSNRSKQMLGETLLNSQYQSGKRLSIDTNGKRVHYRVMKGAGPHLPLLA